MKKTIKTSISTPISCSYSCIANLCTVIQHENAVDCKVTITWSGASVSGATNHVVRLGLVARAYQYFSAARKGKDPLYELPYLKEVSRDLSVVTPKKECQTLCPTHSKGEV